MRKIGFDYAQLENQVISEDDESIVFPAVIAREMVQPYPEGSVYKPAEELEKAAWTAEGRWLTTERHPDTRLITRREDVKGRVEAPRYVKDLVDPKTRRPMDRGIRANLRFYKKNVPAALLDELRSGKSADVSIGFLYDEDKTPGEFRGQKYDFVQRNLFIDHVAAAVPTGRCPSPLCGIGADSYPLPPPTGSTGEKPLPSQPLPHAENEGRCPICDELTRLGDREFSRRLARAFGVDAVLAATDDKRGREGSVEKADGDEGGDEDEGEDEVGRAKRLMRLL